MSDDVIQLSSGDECVSNENNKEYLNSDTSVDSDLVEIISKYSNTQTSSNDKQTTDSNPNISDDEELADIIKIKEKLRQKYNKNSVSQPNTNIATNVLPKLSVDLSPKNYNSDSPSDTDEPQSKKIKSNILEHKTSKQLEKKQEKAHKQAARERIRAEKAKTKAEKLALASVYKNMKPEECIKFITAIIDSNLISSECGPDIPSSLQNANIKFKINSNLHANTIIWSREMINSDNQKKSEDCSDILLILMWNEFVKLVYEKNLSSKIKQSLFSKDIKIHLGIYGLANYFRYQKNQKGKKVYGESPKISRKDADMALIELQILYNTSHRILDTPQDLSAMVVQFSKSIAQIPFKLQKQQTYEQMDKFVIGDNRDCVRVDKHGNGLVRLWQQQLTQLQLARLETAEAISSKYPTPSCLMRAYESCETVEDGEKLLEDIQIRRAAGPLANVRKIGPELSKKIHTLFTSTDEDLLL